jgi:tripartite ATP-independent transporter DctM subunit
VFPEAPAGSGPVGELVGWRRFLTGGENLLITLTLAGMVLLPLCHALLRRFFDSGISGATTIVQHLVLVVGMLGGAAAAREGRLLSLSTVRTLLPGRWKAAALIVSSAYAVAASVLLYAASKQYIAETSMRMGKELAYGIPVWVVQLVLPFGFALIALRMLWRSSTKWSGVALTFALAAALLLLVKYPPFAPSSLVVPLLSVLAISAVLGAPIFTVLGGAALILFWGQDGPIASVALDHYRMVVNPSLPAIPLFTLAGYFLAEGGASKRLIRVFQSLVGRFRGGPALLTALICAFFTSFTGASGVTILALGGLLLPVLLSAGYTERNSIGLLTGAGSLGLLFPPALPLILYAVVASSIGSNVSLTRMFLGGAVPGIVLVALVACWGVLQAPRRKQARLPFDGKELARAVWDAKWELLVPAVAMVSLFGGFATPVEAAAVTALYAFLVETLVYRDLKIRSRVPAVMAECGLLVGGVLLILGVAMSFTNYLVDAQVPDRAVDWVQGSIHSQWVFLLTLNAFLLIVGCLMDIFSAIVVVVPLIVPVATAFGIDPVHLGIIFLANMELGYLTPPVGMNLFLSAYRFGKPVPEVIRAVIPMFLVLLLGVLLITYIPALSTTLPDLFD